MNLQSSERVKKEGKLLRLGEIVNGTYEVGALLGAGAMGEVYEGVDLFLRRTVAIKVAFPVPKRHSLLREAQALAAVKNTGVVTVYAAGVYNSIEFVVMERVFGTSLADHIDHQYGSGRSFSVIEALELLSAAANSLQAVHKAGIAHQDVKPANIILSAEGRVVLVDFGVFVPECIIGEGAGPSGTPNYMAPEALSYQLTPGSGVLVDLYALGVIGFELLTGQVPHDAPTYAQIMERRMKEDAPRVSSLRHDVPGAVSALIADLLAREPSERLQSIEEVQIVLQRELSWLRKSGLRPQSVLLVTKDPSLRRTLNIVGQQVSPSPVLHVVSNFHQALDRLQSVPTDIIVIDQRYDEGPMTSLCSVLRNREICSSATLLSLGSIPEITDRVHLGHCGIAQFFDTQDSLLRAYQKLAKPDYHTKHRNLPSPDCLISPESLVTPNQLTRRLRAS